MHRELRLCIRRDTYSLYSKHYPGGVLMQRDCFHRRVTQQHRSVSIDGAMCMSPSERIYEDAGTCLTNVVLVRKELFDVAKLTKQNPGTLCAVELLERAVRKRDQTDSPHTEAYLEY